MILIPWATEIPIIKSASDTQLNLTIEQLAQRIGATVRGDNAIAVNGCAGLDEAHSDQVSFLANRRYLRSLGETGAAAVIVCPEDARYAPQDMTLLITDDPYYAFRQAAVALHGFRDQPKPGISDQAIIDPTAQVGSGCHIAPLAYVGPGAKVGDRCVVYPHCYIGPHAAIGDDCILYPNVTIYDDCRLGCRVTLHAGCVIGQDGFGYATHQGQHHKIPQIGNVVIEDDVEMGAGCTVDRATVGSTRIGRGTKFSDLVAIGHGAKIGQHNLLVAQVGIAGSTRTGDYVVMGGQAGVAGHLEIGDGVQIAAKAGVINDLPGGGQYGGQPARPMNQTKRSVLAVSRLPEAVQEIRQLQKRVTELEARFAAEAPGTSG